MNVLLLTSAVALCSPILRCHLSPPTNTIATFGQRAELECSTTLTTPLNWEFAEANSTLFQYIYFNEEFSLTYLSRYKIDKSVNGRWALVIDSVDFAHAGTYTCETTPDYIIEETVMTASAQLTVVDSDIICGSNVSNGGITEGDYIQMWCTFNYSWNTNPTMKCARKNEETVDSNVPRSYDSRKVTLSLVTQLNSFDNSVTITCKMSFEPNIKYSKLTKVGDTQAINIPRYQHSWNYTANVFYGPRNQTVMLIDDAMKVGSRLECFADGNPAPNYEWELVGKNIFINSGSVIVISESMVSYEEQTLRCTARNSVVGEIRSKEATFTFNLTDGAVYSQSDTTQSTKKQDLDAPPIIGISVGAMILGLTIVTIIIYKLRWQGNQVNRKGSLRTSVQEHDYEMVDELYMMSGEFQSSFINKNTIIEESCSEPHSPENIHCEGYSSLKRSSSAACVQPAVYAQLHLYANTSVNVN